MPATPTPAPPKPTRMPTKPDNNESKPDHRIALGPKILSLLGKPPNYKNLKISAITPGNYRVNIFVEKTPEKGDLFGYAIISDSFLVQVNDSGEIVQSWPPIEKKY